MENLRSTITERIYDLLGAVDFYGTIYSEGLEESRERIYSDVQEDPLGLSLDLEDLIYSYEDVDQEYIEELKEIKRLLRLYADLIF